MNKIIDSLTLDDVRALAPAAFSATAHPRTSDRYALYKTSDIVESLLGQGWKITRAHQSAVKTETQREYAQHLVALSRPELKYQEEQIEFLIFNSNDGRSKYHNELGVLRFACANGVIDSSNRFAEMDLRHFGYTSEQVQGAAQKVIERAAGVVEVIDAWKGKRLAWATQVELARFAARQRFGSVEEAPIQPGELLDRRRDQDRGDDLWTVFNVIQENALRGGQSYQKNTRRGPRWLSVRPIRSIGTNVAINKSLWRAAESLYKDDGLVLAS